MNQSDIYKLLLSVLFIANRQLSENPDGNCIPENSTDSAAGSTFSYSSVNDALLLVMLFSGFSPDSGSSPTTPATTF